MQLRKQIANMSFATSFWNHFEAIRNYVKTIRKRYSIEFLRSRLYRPEARFILPGHICAYLMQGALITLQSASGCTLANSSELEAYSCPIPNIDFPKKNKFE